MNNPKIAIIGLGYVGLPLAIEFGKKYAVVGFDINTKRISELKSGFDHNKELAADELLNAKLLDFSAEITSIQDCDIYIITVPTPIDVFKKPDLSFLLKATEIVGSVLKIGDVDSCPTVRRPIVIYESSVYPGCTEEDCVPVLEKISGLKFNQDFFCGYSPERISPGDKSRTLTKIIKITSGSTPAIAAYINELYGSIIEAGTYLAPSIKVAEAAKSIENAQRDVNISFINEVALIFDKMGIDTQEVLAAAGTKWNFMKFQPGLVGGHCISVDPYYLAHKAESLGYSPQVILSGRRVNEYMSSFVVNKLLKLLVQNGCQLHRANVLILGITFKENCSDIRNSRVVEMYHELRAYGVDVDIYDLWANKEEVFSTFKIQLLEKIQKKYDGIILAIAHNEFINLPYNKIKKKNAILMDLKGILPKNSVDVRL